MSAVVRYRIRSRELLELLACCAGVGLAAWLYQKTLGITGAGGWSAESILGLSIMALTCWLVTVFSDGAWTGGLRLWIDRFFSAVGLTLVILYGLVYVFHITPTPWPIVVSGCSFSIVLVALIARRQPALAKGTPGILLVGFDSSVKAFAPFLRSRIVGVLDRDAACVPPGLPFMGDLTRLDEAVASRRPECIIVSEQAGVSSRQLLNLRHSGISVETGPAVYENLVQRVSWAHLDPLDLLFSSASIGNRAALAFQAIYTNLIGLGLLLVLLPLLLVTAVTLGVFLGGNPLEQIECLGFQRIPFQKLRFRIRRRDGRSSRIGNAVSRLHLVNLPQLINVVRGEMALFGPPAARRIFAERIRQIIPLYSQRYTVKPGILGWSQANLRAQNTAPDEALRLEYDLYYVKQESPSLDLDILARTIFGVTP